MGGVVRRYIDFLIILLIPTPLVLALFLQQHPYFVHLKNVFHSYIYRRTLFKCVVKCLRFRGKKGNCEFNFCVCMRLYVVCTWLTLLLRSFKCDCGKNLAIHNY